MNLRPHLRPRARLAARSIALALPAMLAGPPVVQSQTPAPISIQAPAAAGAEPSGPRSAFEGYRAHTEEKIRDWKLANDEVGRIGGWRAYAREANAPDFPRRDAGSASSAHRKQERETPPPGTAGDRLRGPDSDRPANAKP